MSCQIAICSTSRFLECTIHLRGECHWTGYAKRYPILEIDFRTNKLEKCFKESRQANKEFGAQVGRKYIQRIILIKAAKDLNAVMQLPGLRCHPLKGDRKGQYAVNLTGFYRLIFTVEGDKLNIAMIEEVSKHYDD